MSTHRTFNEDWHRGHEDYLEWLAEFNRLADCAETVDEDVRNNTRLLTQEVWIPVDESDPVAAESDPPNDNGTGSPVTTYQRRLLITTILLVISLPLILFGAQQSFASILTLTSRWLPPTFSERKVLDQFMQDFESGDSVFITWADCDLDDPRLNALGNALTESARPTENVNRLRLIDSVVTGSELVESLTMPPTSLTRSEAASRLQGILVGVDGVSSGALIGLTEEGVQQRESTMELILTNACSATGVPREQFILAGPPVDGWVVDREAKSNVDTLTPPSILISMLLCMWCLRSWAHSAAVLTSALVAQGILLAVMYFSGIRMNALFIVLPPLVMTLTVSAGIHLVNYFRDERDSGGTDGAVARAMAHGRGPCLLAAGTTAIGLMSLLRSDITPVTQFGWLAAVGVLVGIGLLFLLLPGVLERWPGKGSSSTVAGLAGNAQSETCPRIISTAPSLMIILCLMVMMFMGKGVESIRTSVAHDSLFPPDSQIVRDYRQLESQLGPLVPAEVLLHFEPGTDVQFMKHLKLVQEIDQAVCDLDGFGGTLSAASFDTNTSKNAASREEGQHRVSPSERYRKFRAQVESLREVLLNARLLHETEDRQTLRISTRVPALGDVDYARSLEQLRDRVEQILDEHRTNGVVVSAEYTGIMPMVSRVQDVLLRDLFVSFLSAFGLVAVVTIIVLRSVFSGLLVMLPNLFPAVIVFGAMGWLQIPVDIGAMMTASVALGIVVDDTFHFLTWFRRGTREGLSAHDAMQLAYRRCAKAMIQTTLICGLGMAVFGFSEFIPTQRFACLMLTLLVAALIGDLIFLPALLSGMTRRVFALQRPT